MQASDAECRRVKRVAVSSAFFLSIEFRQTGYLVIRAHKAALLMTKALRAMTLSCAISTRLAMA
jgi:hypothetical protein